nr:glycoside hydrolase family 3 N-terminal domain-containing protein [uncultured Romboutsia sp.]
MNDKTKELIVDKKVGGIILFKDNINDSNQLLQLINNIKDINSKNKMYPIE